MNITEKLEQIIAKEDENIELNQKLEDVLSIGNLKSNYDEFWDSYQDNGNRTDYSFAFYGSHWNDKCLKPKYDIVPIYPNCMFKSNPGIKENISDYFEKQGIKLDFSKCTNFTETFAQPGIVGVGTVDTRSAANIGMAFVWNSNIKEIREFILKDDGSQTIDGSCFTGASNLEILNIKGHIGCSFTAKLSLLTKTSIESIVNALLDSNGATLTLSKAAVDKAFETELDKKDGSSSIEWINLISSKSNQYQGLWTISLT